MNELNAEIQGDNTDLQHAPKTIKLHVPKTTTLLDKKYVCKYCNMRYTRETYLLKHIVVHGKWKIGGNQLPNKY